MARKKVLRNDKELSDEELREIYYPMNEKTGKRGKKYLGFSLRDNESTVLLRWIETQTNFSESLRQLIEQHILAEGKISDLTKPRNLDELFLERVGRGDEEVGENLSKTSSDKNINIESLSSPSPKDDEVEVETARIIEVAREEGEKEASNTEVTSKVSGAREKSAAIKDSPKKNDKNKEKASTAPTKVESDDADIDNLADSWG